MCYFCRGSLKINIHIRFGLKGYTKRIKYFYEIPFRKLRLHRVKILLHHFLVLFIPRTSLQGKHVLGVSELYKEDCAESVQWHHHQSNVDMPTMKLSLCAPYSHIKKDERKRAYCQHDALSEKERRASLALVTSKEIKLFL